DIFEHLRRDHRNVRSLLDEIEGAEDDRQRQGLFAQLVNEVEAHSQAEDDVLYTSLENAPQLADRIDEARQEHDQVESLLEELDGLPVSGDDWLEKVREIRLLLEHHIGEEEGAVFPLARGVLGDREARRLGHEFLRARRLVTEEVSSERLVAETTADSTATLAEATDMVDVSVEVDDLASMSKRELYELARQRRIEGRSAMSKAELARALRAAR
ncbi:MAG TPA: hemerythrin domain-containing protein, partial [Kofleriaceae bacterium]|nr:hemerythrin domain-containing protein [Kofleriaceae bacterium]